MWTLHASTGTGEHSPPKGTSKPFALRSQITRSPIFELVEADMHSYIHSIRAADFVRRHIGGAWVQNAIRQRFTLANSYR